MKAVLQESSRYPIRGHTLFHSSIRIFFQDNLPYSVSALKNLRFAIISILHDILSEEQTYSVSICRSPRGISKLYNIERGENRERGHNVRIVSLNQILTG